MATKIFFVLSLFLGICLIFGDAMALDYPKREVEYIVAYAPGSTTDNLARVAVKFGEKSLGKPIVIVNKPGGGRGWSALAAAKPDGYTIGGISNVIIAHSYLLKGVNYNLKSFKPITRIGYGLCGLFVKKGGPYDIPLKELVKKAKEKPKTLKAGIGGQWAIGDFVRGLFEDVADIQTLRVPFPGVGEVIPALLGGHVDVEYGSEWAPLYKAGKLSVLALAIEKRDPRVPEIPTFKELGFDVVLAATHYVAGPAALPDPIVNHLSEAFKKGFSEKAFVDALDSLECVGGWESPESSMKSLEEIDRIYQRVIKRLDLKPE
jgi:tripartite-type tricarboxylate transporter receptor subunit TctC